MSASQVLARFPLAQKIRSVLTSCEYARTARDYAGQLVAALATATDSPFCIWLNSPVDAGSVLAQTRGAAMHRVLALCSQAPLISNELEDDGIRAIAAAPILFRGSVAGVLAVANGTRPYTAADLELLALTGRTALLEYEIRDQADELELKTMARRVADLAHDLRQPLGIMEACACLLELLLPAADTRACGHVDEIRRQIELAGGIVEEALRGYLRPAGASRDFANSAISMVT